MCGIAAVLLHPRRRSAAQWASVREIFTRNLVFNEDRGKEATGCAVVRSDGRVRLVKEPVSASEFVARVEYRALMNSIDSRTTLILGHTRRPTKGDPANLANDHPIAVGPVFGAHNGQIDNDDELFAKCNLPRQAEVDSEIIFKLLSLISPVPQPGSYLREVQHRVEMLKGHFTFLACDVRNPGRLVVFRHTNPLCLHHERAWQGLVFSSSYLFLRRAFGHAVVAESLALDHLALFSADAIPELGTLPVATLQLTPRELSDGE